MQVRKEIEEIKFEQSFPEDLYLLLLGLGKQVLPKKKLLPYLLVLPHTCLPQLAVETAPAAANCALLMTDVVGVAIASDGRKKTQRVQGEILSEVRRSGKNAALSEPCLAE